MKFYNVNTGVWTNIAGTIGRANGKAVINAFTSAYFGPQGVTQPTVIQYLSLFSQNLATTKICCQTRSWNCIHSDRSCPTDDCFR